MAIVISSDDEMTHEGTKSRTLSAPQPINIGYLEFYRAFYVNSRDVDIYRKYDRYNVCLLCKIILFLQRELLYLNSHQAIAPHFKNIQRDIHDQFWERYMVYCGNVTTKLDKADDSAGIAFLCLI
ncbi:hypothetical protein LOAG_04278 [Loa loa]|uniref:Uncharacterized protein n=1 Tax=Loa loa TaxID=7209 RepID=A0A1S0U2R8_LOALO|nr:hypothetical protein LOAG_04278 [Loa loa]EFO24205.1 hypothetical protein LOAG_04278 [Loa loa]